MTQLLFKPIPLPDPAGLFSGSKNSQKDFARLLLRLQRSVNNYDRTKRRRGLSACLSPDVVLILPIDQALEAPNELRLEGKRPVLDFIDRVREKFGVVYYEVQCIDWISSISEDTSAPSLIRYADWKAWNSDDVEITDTLDSLGLLNAALAREESEVLFEGRFALSIIDYDGEPLLASLEVEDSVGSVQDVVADLLEKGYKGSTSAARLHPYGTSNGIGKQHGGANVMPDAALVTILQRLARKYGNQEFVEAVGEVLPESQSRLLSEAGLIPEGAIRFKDAVRKYQVSDSLLGAWVQRKYVRKVSTSLAGSYVNEDDVRARIAMSKDFKEKNKSRFPDG